MPKVVRRIFVGGTALAAVVAYAAMASRQDALTGALSTKDAVPVPNLVLPVLGSHERRSLADYRGKAVVLTYWASWCIPCRAEAPRLERLHRQMLRRGGLVLGVDARGDLESEAEGFVRELGVTYLNLRDVDGAFARVLGADELALTFVIDRRGRALALARGIVSQSFIENQIRPLLERGAD